MRARLTCLLAATSVLAGCSGAAPRAPSPGTVAAPRRAEPLAQLEASVDLSGAIVGRATEAKGTLVVLFTSWCEHCKTELEVIAQLRARHASLRILGVNYRAHEEYDQRGNAEAVRAYVERHAPWLRVVPADDTLFAAFGRPPKVPTLFVYDAAGALVARYDRRERRMPDAAELDALLATLGP